MESYLHQDIKHDLYWSLVQDGYSVCMEKTIHGRYKPDLLVDIGGNTLAVEIQKSYIPPETIYRRMLAHTAAGAYTLWLIPETVLATLLHRKKWCELIQQLQYGIIFIPDKGSYIKPARLDFLGKSKRKFIDYYDRSIEINELSLEINVIFRLNTVVWKPWWLEHYLDLSELASYV